MGSTSSSEGKGSAALERDMQRSASKSVIVDGIHSDQTLELSRPIYAPTAAYGHFGRELPACTWEKVHPLDTH